jgi:hypothetical protein
MNEELNTQGGTSQDETPQETQDNQTLADTTESTETTEQAEPFQKVQNDLQSWMGRKLKEELSERDERLFGKLADLFNQNQVPTQPQFQGQPVQPQVPYQDPDPRPDPDVDVEAFIEWRDRQKAMQETQSRQMNDTTYFQTLEMPDIKHPDQKVHTAVLEDMKANQGHSMVTGNPAADAALNYAKALSRVTNQMIPTPQNPLAGNQPPGPGLGTTTPSSDGASNVSSMPKLSPAAAKIVARGMADKNTSKNWTGAEVRKKLGMK